MLGGRSGVRHSFSITTIQRWQGKLEALRKEVVFWSLAWVYGKCSWVEVVHVAVLLLLLSQMGGIVAVLHLRTLVGGVQSRKWDLLVKTWAEDMA